MKGKWLVGGLLVLVVLLLTYVRSQNAIIGEITSSDHQILRILSVHRAISNSDSNFLGFLEVCIVNKVEVVGSDGRICKTTGEAIALIKENSCEVISLEKLSTRVLLSENTRECRKTNEPFQIVFHKRFDNTEVLDFD